MDVRYFLNERLSFILNFYDEATTPFIDVQRKIEAQEPPFVEKYSEDGEPQYFEEWLAADESQQVIGHTCISMLSAALHLYLHITIKQRGGDTQRISRNKGWLKGCQEYCDREFGLQFQSSGADLEVMQEITLARNRIQHPEDIASSSPTYSRADLKRIPNVIFVTDIERAMLTNSDKFEPNWIFEPSVYVDKKKLVAAIEEVRVFANWLDSVA